ncbi:MAG: hypothetical protein A2365_01525 [Candidatus Nealsonbacteria bacterium RIFOXYB1_FULL_40_15]|uniref:Uncharacterized protein n=2 Tax=Candidatus Nealsoniibacteriota TaxID=1817911 RepID=A0A1G2EMH9_9BACT|nr:MAG: hypothetical protein A2427_00065 [Candidatus Nealsonbacteria bacterium RIFOXYC1_FULL_40_7]OGZ27252.1 MAG: hypothetical protein A2365_01525 [Candidatus Nealsonbacteria bacterium RIFOXYB1_FULL_40_15]OGZ29289.1 MAG: hypothetical protein A2562_02755 [Candidatus Nealsonbacteria bacterium RIFOXYD1_FULL_39_11]
MARINEDLKFWQARVVSRECTIILESETDARGGHVSSNKSQRTLHKGDIVVMTGGDNSRYYLRLGGKEGEKVAIYQQEAEKIEVEN